MLVRGHEGEPAEKIERLEETGRRLHEARRPRGLHRVGSLVLDARVEEEPVLDEGPLRREIELVTPLGGSLRRVVERLRAVVGLRPEGVVVDEESRRVIGGGGAVELVRSAPGLHGDDGSERVVLRLEAAGRDLDRLERILLEVRGEGVRDRVGEVEAVDEVAVVVRLPALDVRVASGRGDARDLLGDRLVRPADRHLVRSRGRVDLARLRGVRVREVALLLDYGGLFLLLLRRPLDVDRRGLVRVDDHPALDGLQTLVAEDEIVGARRDRADLVGSVLLGLGLLVDARPALERDERTRNGGLRGGLDDGAADAAVGHTDGARVLLGDGEERGTGGERSEERSETELGEGHHGLNRGAAWRQNT